jgi:hypothetical protein
MKKCFIAFALVVAMGGSVMAGDTYVATCEVVPACPVVCLPYTKKVAVNPCNPCEKERVVVACPNIWGKIFGPRHAPTAN